jgi:hypothetical protein
MEFDDFTMAQVVHIQINTIMKYLQNFLDGASVYPKDIDKIQKMFDITNDKKLTFKDKIKWLLRK